MPTILRYGIAVLSVAIANGLAFFVLRHFEAILTPFLFAVAATVWYAGTGPGVLAIVLSVLSLNHFFLRPFFSFSPISYADLVYLTFCTLCALAVGWVSALRRRAEQELHQARKELEAKVVERTASLQRSEDYLAGAQRLSHSGVSAYNETAILYGSEETYRIWGFDPAQGVPSREAVFQRIHPDDRDRLNAEVQRAVSEKSGYSAAYRIVLPDGTIKHLETIGRPAFSASGELVEIVTTQIDVTERKRAEEALREREAKIQHLVDSNIIGIFIWDFDGRILEANDEFLRMVGYDREDLLAGRIRWADLTPPDWRDRNNARIEQQKSSGRFEPFEKEYTRKDGRRVPVLIGGATFEEGGNQGVAYVLDLTERKRVEAEARESEQRYREVQLELAHANRVATTGQLTASITHEVNQPITAAVTYALAARRFPSAEPPNFREVDDALSLIVKEGNRAGEVVGRIRALIKKTPARKDAVEINDAILEVIALARAEAANNSVSVRTQLAEGLPRVQGDRVQLQQVLLNLIINAIEAMRDVGEEERELQHPY